jgi:hypothetical protein
MLVLCAYKINDLKILTLSSMMDNIKEAKLVQDVMDQKNIKFTVHVTLAILTGTKVI